MAQIIIFVEGGMVRQIVSDQLVDVAILDADVEGIPYAELVDIDGDMYSASVRIADEIDQAYVQRVLDRLMEVLA